MNVIFLGPPGAGKGTIAKEIKDLANVIHLSTGDMLREEMRNGTELGKMAKQYIEEGKLVPDEVIIGMVESKHKSSDKGILFDGFPRTVDQAKALDQFAKIDAVINLYTTVDVIVKRVGGRRICRDCGKVFNTSWYDSDRCDECGGELYTRADDTEETIKKRYEVYVEQTEPLVDYYREKGILHDIDANGEIQEKVDKIKTIFDNVQ